MLYFYSDGSSHRHCPALHAARHRVAVVTVRVAALASVRDYRLLSCLTSEPALQSSKACEGFSRWYTAIQGFNPCKFMRCAGNTNACTLIC